MGTDQWNLIPPLRNKGGRSPLIRQSRLGTLLYEFRSIDVLAGCLFDTPSSTFTKFNFTCVFFGIIHHGSPNVFRTYLFTVLTPHTRKPVYSIVKRLRFVYFLPLIFRIQ